MKRKNERVQEQSLSSTPTTFGFILQMIFLDLKNRRLYQVPLIVLIEQALAGFSGHGKSTKDAEKYLSRIRNGLPLSCIDIADRAVMEIMKTHKWRVLLLKEFPPSLETGIVGVTDGCLLGFNQNQGQVIGLRLRTG